MTEEELRNEMGVNTQDNGNTKQSQLGGRDDGTVLIAGYHFLISGMFLLGTVVLSIPTAILGIVALTQAFEAIIGMFAVGLIAGVSMAFCLLYLSIGYGLWKRKQWGRIGAIALAVISLFIFPVGTIIGGLILWYLMQPHIADQFA